MSEELPVPSGLTVIRPGVLSTLQDLGRFGVAQHGFSQGGPLDLHAHCWANKLVGNSSAAATLEITVGLAAFRAETDLHLSLTGADMRARVDDTPITNWRSFTMQPGQELTLQAAPTGLRAYLAVAGGFRANPALGSVSTVTRNHLGGLLGNGAPLAAGDHLPAAPAQPARSRRTPFAYIPRMDTPVDLRIIPSGQHNLFSPAAREVFFAAEYTVTPASDRMGARLEGPAIPTPEKGIVSEGIPLGAVQIPPDGQPIVLLNDRQTLGGYPKIGCVARVDLPRLAQARPGTPIRFSLTTPEEATRAWHDFCRFFQYVL